MDDEILKGLFKSWVGAILRAVIVAAGAWLKANGKLPATFLDSAIGQTLEAVPQLTGDLLILAGVGWSFVQKWRSHATLQTTKDAPAGKTIVNQ